MIKQRYRAVTLLEAAKLSCESRQGRAAVVVSFVVAKLHAPAHKRECRYTFSLDYLEGTGRTDGEAVERTWSEQNGLALRTREMNEGHRHDTINDFHGHGNDRRTTTIGACIVFFVSRV